MTDSEQAVKERCCECNEEVDVENGCGWSNVQEDHLCEGCQNSDYSSASQVQVVIDGVVAKYHIGAHIRITEHGDDLYGVDLKFSRAWQSSDGWRGHFDTTIEGWTEVLTGWTTGGWDDPTAQRKAHFNQWADDLLRGETFSPVPVAIVADPTSNVFSMGISVLTPDPVALREWLDQDFQELHDSLS